MNTSERWIIAVTLAGIAMLTSVDLYNDYFEGVADWHLTVESVVAVLALAGIFVLIRGRFRLRRSLVREQQFSRELREEADKWQRVSKSYLDGLSAEIDRQLTRWELTEAEKEVAFLLLKGLALKEIGAVRGTTAKTARSQANAIYTKSGLSGRSELSAFFLEDLLLPGSKANED